MNRVKDKVAIITGAASGMGKADALLLAEEGARVVLCDLNEADGQAVADQIGEAALFLRHDVTDEESWRTVVSRTVEHFGQVDILVNNAGLLLVGSVVDTDLETYRKINAVNNEGVFLGCKHVLPVMEESGGGSIINMSSAAAVQGMSFIAGYSASKGAVAALTRSVALYCRERKNGIRCNAIYPDGVKTPMVAKVASGRDTATQEEVDALGQDGSMCEPEDIAALVLYLAADESHFVNGAELRVDNAASVAPPYAMP